MATLTVDDYTAIKRHISGSFAKSVLKNLPLDKQTWKDVFQAAEDWFVFGFTDTPTESFKSAIESVAGALTLNQAKAIGVVWMQWRWGKG